MPINVSFSTIAKTLDTAVFLVSDVKKLTPILKRLDSENSSVITKAIKSANFEAKRGKFLSVFLPNSKPTKIIIAGIEKEIKFAERELRYLGGEIQGCLVTSQVKTASVVIESSIYGNNEGFVAAQMAYGARVRSFTFLKYFTKKKEEDKPSLTSLTFNLDANKEAETRYKILAAIAEGVELAKTVVTEPPNVIYPESYADLIKDELKAVGVKVEILDEKDMKKLGMNALLGVGQGSRRESRLVVMTYNGSSNKKQKPIAFVGKGVTFDTGGISIKPSTGMEDMKYDMGGSAAVVGVMKALAGRGAKVNAVGVVGLVENMPDGNAQRPSDVVVSMSGQTIEVLNTDAEGRLVLADALWYTQEKFDPKFMIDLATLTGACAIALGIHKAAILSNDDDLSAKLFEAGEEVGEHLWRLPMGDEYDKQIDSKIADVQNISNTKGGGTITAGQFLKRFVNDKKWAHLDIASVAWADKPKPLAPEGATGFGVQLLDRLVSKHYED